MRSLCHGEGLDSTPGEPTKVLGALARVEFAIAGIMSQATRGFLYRRTNFQAQVDTRGFIVERLVLRDVDHRVFENITPDGDALAATAPAKILRRAR